MWRGRLGLSSSRDFSTASQHLVAAVCFKLRRLQPCLLSSLSWNVDVEDEGEVQLTLSGVAVAFAEQGKGVKEGEVKEGELVFRLDEGGQSESNEKLKLKLSRPPPYFLCSASSPMIGVNITPTPHVPGARIDHHLGNLNLFYIRETSSVREAGGLSSFLQRFLCEVLGILRAQVSALGGNAVTSYSLATCVLSHSPHKNQVTPGQPGPRTHPSCSGSVSCQRQWGRRQGCLCLQIVTTRKAIVANVSTSVSSLDV